MILLLRGVEMGRIRLLMGHVEEHYYTGRFFHKTITGRYLFCNNFVLFAKMVSYWVIYALRIEEGQRRLACSI